LNTQLHPETSVRPATPFLDLGLTTDLSETVHAAGYSQPTPIQAKAIPTVLTGRDVLGCAQTGTGKTAAFALPILQHLAARPPRSKRRPVRALILAPTRELAAQIGDNVGRYAAGTPLRHLVIFGGVGKHPQIGALRRGVDVLIATPGRLLDLMSEGAVSLDAVEHMVLDEADRMLDMGFLPDVRRILARLPEKRQTLLFSATLPKEIEKLARQFLIDPERIAVDPVSSTCEPIEQSVYMIDQKLKTALLIHLLQDGSIDRALIFTRTKHGANRLAQKLTRSGISASAIHGNKSQSAREKTLLGLRSGEIRVVVATDLASRGLDVKGLSHVVNYDLPNEPETYVHRVGRTGRAGESGIAVALCAQDEQPYLRDIERLIGKKLVRRDDVVLADLPRPAEVTDDRHDRRGPRSQQGQPRRGRNGRAAGERSANRADRNGERRFERRTGPAADDRRSGRDMSGRDRSAPQQKSETPREAAPRRSNDRRREAASPHRSETREDRRAKEPTRGSEDGRKYQRTTGYFGETVQLDGGQPARGRRARARSASSSDAQPGAGYPRTKTGGDQGPTQSRNGRPRRNRSRARGNART
jgi:ATP-dependent RNA helicase RhlE